jgi:preprotein translocase subunit YajC
MLSEFGALVSAAAEKQSASGSSLIPKIAMLLVFLWLIVLRPQKKERQRREQQLAGIKKGDRVVTSGGIHGKVTDVDSGRKILTVEVAPKTPIKVNQDAISTVMSKDSGKSPATEEKGEK